ncbi:MFS transporter [Roseisalinus antarcticus]|uniref:Inner membrane protein YbjJ n=1 Tax=Roseisalinus antarcticus TaxID=254357 RepID=A0A1Y5RSX2_9RHOB|nr:MFS transporter [Roseisalinus antarcticus]SLN24274.1 Inner membrane protein YbjJ [Roseisalinus antarcticus]
MSILSALTLSRRPATGFVIVGIFWGGFAAHVPVLKAQLGASDALFGLLLLGTAAGLVSSMWLAPRLDRTLGARGMQVAALALALAWLFPGHMSVQVLFFVSLIFVGGASGLLDVTMNARVSDLEAQTGRSLMNANHAIFSVAYAVAALISGVTREAGIPPGWVFTGFSVVTILLLPVLRMAPAAVEPEVGYAGAYPLWPILLSGLVVLVAFMSEATVEAWSALHVERTLGGGAVQGALGPTMLGITMAVGRFSGQVVAERLREVPVIVGASLLSACGVILAAVAPVPALAYIGFGIFGLGVSVVAPMGLALVGKLVAPHLRTEAISRAAVMGFSGFFFAPVFMGLVSELFGLRAAFGGVALLALCAVPLALALGRYPLRTAQIRP